MKYIIVLAALLPFYAHADSKDRTCENERVIIKRIDATGNEQVTEESRKVCKERTREVFSDCERYQWNHQWGQTNVISCNWSEYEAMQAALTYAPDGVKIEWYDSGKNTKGSFIAWTLAPTQSGQCRKLLRSRKFPGAVEEDIDTRCHNQNTGWQSFRRY
jgi:hypothetical protein